VASTMDTNNYQWGYESIYEEDALFAAAAQLTAWKEQLNMNAQWGYEEDALSAAAQLAAWEERLKMNAVISPTCNTCGVAHLIEGCPFTVDNVQYMEQYNYSQQEDMYSNTYNPDRRDYPNFLGHNDQNTQWPSNLSDSPQPMQQSENESSLEELMAQYIQTQTVSLKNLETLMGQMTNTLAQLCIQPESFPSNTESNPRHDDRAQCPSMIKISEVQPEPQTQNVDELVTFSSSSPDPNPMMPTPSLFKQSSFNHSEEKAPQVEISTFPPKIRYVPPELNSSYQEMIIATTNDIGVDEKTKNVRLHETNHGYIMSNLTGKHSSPWKSGKSYFRVATLPLLKPFDPGGKY
ncbi:hypothetical protein ACLOJK_022654, partial [Asimina triloba]